MQKKIFCSVITFVALFFSVLPCFAQFPFALGGSGSDEGRSIARDASNNVIVTGHFSGTVDFDPSGGTFNLNASGTQDVYVAKYTSAGALSWAFKIGGSQSDYGYGVTTDASNNVLVTGSFRGTADFDPSGSTVNLSSSGNQDIFVAKYSSAGSYQWAIKIGSSNPDYGEAIAVDGAGNVYVTGDFQGTADFDPSGSTANLSNSGLQDAFVAKYSSSGSYQWAFKIGTASADYGYGIAIDGNSNVLVTGVFNGTADFDPSGATVNLTTNGNRDIYVGKYSSAGAYVWAFNIGSTDVDYGYGIKTDAGGNVFLSGYFAQTCDFNPSAGTANLVSAGGADIFFAKYNSSGAYQWAYGMGGVGNDISYNIALDGAGNILITGYFQGSVDFDPGAGTALLSGSGADEAFVAKYNSSGGYVCTFAISGNSWDSGFGIAADAGNNILVAGYFTGTADFDPGAGTMNISSSGGSLDAFVGKFGSGCTLTPSSVNETATINSIAVYPNPAYLYAEYEISVVENSAGTLFISDLSGKILLQQDVVLLTGKNHIPLNVSSLNNGLYFAIVKTEKIILAEKLVVQK